MKEIAFDKQKTGKSYFDLVDLEYILSKKPTDHSQHDHHKISFFVILIITHGKGKHSINYKNYDFQKGTVFTLRKGVVHKFYKTKARGKLLLFTDDFVAGHANKVETQKLFRLFNEMLSSPKTQLDNNEFGNMEILLSQIEKECLLETDYHSTEIIRNFIQVVIHKLYRANSALGQSFDDRYLSSFILFQQMVEAECFEYKNVAYYAKKIGVTSRTLNNITQSIIGKSAKPFIDEVLILQIKRLIMSSNLSFTEIAYQTGFNDSTNFFKYFRKNTGSSPKEFKAKFA